MIASPIIRGLCTGCNNAIWNIDPLTNQIKGTLSNYREFCFVTHIEDIVDGEPVIRPGSERMNRHAICSSCINELDDKKVEQIFERIRETWRQMLAANPGPVDFTHIEKLLLVCWDIDEKACERKYYGES